MTRFYQLTIGSLAIVLALVLLSILTVFVLPVVLF